MFQYYIILWNQGRRLEGQQGSLQCCFRHDMYFKDDITKIQQCSRSTLSIVPHFKAHKLSSQVGRKSKSRLVNVGGLLGCVYCQSRNEMSNWCWYWFCHNASLRPRALLSFWKSTKSLENEVLGLPTREPCLW